MSRFLLNGQDLYGNAPQTGDKVSVVDTEGIVGQAGSTTNSQALFDGIAGDLGEVKTDLSDKLNMADYAKTGSINVLNNAAATATSNNVVFTVNADKTITVYTNGAASADANCEIITSNVPVDDDLYLTGCPSGGSSTTYGIQFYSTNVPNGGWDVGSGRKISATDTITRIVIRIRSGQNIPSSSPLVFKIMLSPIKDAPYVPYAMTNRELTKSVSGSAEDVSFTTTTQTKYEYRSISSIKRRGNFVQCCIRMQSLTGNELPSGKTYTYVLTGLPRIATDLEATVPSGTSLSNNPMQIVYFANGTLGVRGGSPNDYYNASFLGLIV